MQPVTKSTNVSKILWISAVLIALVTALILADTETRYSRFIEGLNDVGVEVLWSRSEEGTDKTTLHFDVVFRNASELPMSVEALNTQLLINGTYVISPSITEGEFLVAPKGERTVPLEAVLWQNGSKMYLDARASGQGRLEVTGRTRVRFQTGRSGLKVFYDVQGVFPLREGT